MDVKCLLVFDSDYPEPGSSSPGDEFVRVRLEEYVARGVHVTVIGQAARDKTYFYNGICITKLADRKKILALISSSASSLVLIHFLPGWLAKELRKIKDKRFIVWVHGWEALAWYRRLYLYRDRGFIKYAIANIGQLYAFRNLIDHSNSKTVNCHFVFVSEWMRRICQADCFTRINSWSVIPNPIDVKYYSSSLEKKECYKNILMIRSFENRKYATDIAADFVERLLGHPGATKVTVTIFGAGRYFSQDTARLSKFQNVHLHERYLSKQEIKRVYSEHGFFLCPTRQDAQGVSMCEAMSAGLVPISNPSTAIPEFVTGDYNGIISPSIDIMVSKTINLITNYNEWLKLSVRAKEGITEIAGMDRIIETELKLMSQMCS